MKNKAKEHKRFILGRTPLEAILSYRNWTGLTTRELWQAGRLGNHPGEHLMIIIEELFPTSQVSQIKPRNMLVSKAIEELNTLAPVYGYDKETK